MTDALYSLASLCVRRCWIVLGIWLVVVVGCAAGAASLGPNTSDNLTLPGTDSQHATDVLTARFPQQANGSNPVVMQAPSGQKLTDQQYASAVNATASSLAKDPGVQSAVSPLASNAKNQLTPGQTIGYIPLVLKLSPSQLTIDDANRIIAAEKPARDAGLVIATGGYLGQKVSKPGTESSEAVGLAAAVIILLFTFGTVVAMGLPILTAVFGLALQLSILVFLSQVTDVPTVSPTLGTMIGLGVGIDYALFIVTKHRTHLQQGMEVKESIARACATSGGAVAFAGMTVVVALVSLIVAGIPIVSSLGYLAAIAVVVAVLAALTLLPAALGALGLRINSLKIPIGKHEHDERPEGWARWAKFVNRNPIPSALIAVVVLVVLALPIFSLTLGQQDVGSMPTSTTVRQAYDLMTKGFGVGTNGPLLIAVQLDTPAAPASNPSSDPRLTKLQSDMSKQPNVASVSPPQVNSALNAAIYSVIASTSPSSSQTADLVKHLRSSTIPPDTTGQNMEAYVGGTTAGNVDLASKISAKLPMMILIVVGLSFLILMIAFRSILVPLKAGLLNLLSVAAAFGVVTAVFEKGWGISLVGLDHTVPIVSFVPLLMFAILFGLSMDYEVFLMSQIQERFRKTQDPHDSVVEGLARTGRVITSAALIMVCVFASFVLNGDPTVKQFGVGLSVAIAVDATIVRCLLVPAVMVMMGKAAWWMPRWLDRALPHIHIEGEGHFEAIDARAAETKNGGGSTPGSEPAREPADVG